MMVLQNFLPMKGMPFSLPILQDGEFQMNPFWNVSEKLISNLKLQGIVWFAWKW